MMERRTSIFEKSTEANRNLIALTIISLTIVGIIIISYLYFVSSKEAGTSEKIFNALLPLFATWIGTVLAFYFGRENFEAASNRYEEIIQTLNADLLDDVLVNQIMITKKTMVYLDISAAKSKNVADLISFLNSVNKNRLPVLENDSIKYIIHKSTLLEASNKQGNANPISFDEFIKANKAIIEGFLLVGQDEILENVRKKIKDNPNVKDVFVVGQNDKVLGWLTDTLIMRYMKI